NDLRRVLSYSLINQVGFMVCGIGIGTELAINGAVSHAFNDILFKALLFMSIGAVMYRTGRVNATDLGGLYKTMPLTCIFCMVGAASISAFPLFSGFVSKSMVMEAAADGNMRLIWFMLLFASAGVFHHAGIKIPFFAFFSHDPGIRTKEAPWNMLLAMGITAGLCIFIGSVPGPLYSLLPYPVNYTPYTTSHVLGQTQLLFFSSLAFTLLILSGIYPSEIRAINLDFDWVYRKGSALFVRCVIWFFDILRTCSGAVLSRGILPVLNQVGKDGLARAALLFMVTYWMLTGTRGKRLEMKKTKLYNDIMKGTLPIGLGAGLAALFISVLFFLTR
ncbi:MAG: Na(+)/H(+) antiporter subunit D, partial [Deltaproteobacteria bacterium]